MTKRFFAALILLTSCKGGPEVKPANNPELTSQELSVASQELTEFKLRLNAAVTSPEPATLEKVSYEIVVDGKVVSSLEQPLNLAVSPGTPTEFSIEGASKYVGSAEELKAMSERGGSLLSAVRGKVVVKRNGKPFELPFARSREIRVPRLPSVKMHEIDAARYSAEEANVVFHLGVVNPNPFPIDLDGLDYAITISGKRMAEGTLGKGEKVSAASTGVFEAPIAITQETYGADVQKLIKGLTLKYQVQGQLAGDLFQLPYDLSGEIKLRASTN